MLDDGSQAGHGMVVLIGVRDAVAVLGLPYESAKAVHSGSAFDAKAGTDGFGRPFPDEHLLTEELRFALIELRAQLALLGDTGRA